MKKTVWDDRVFDRDYWRKLCPKLHIGSIAEALSSPARRPALSPFDWNARPTVSSIRAALLRDGYAALEVSENKDMLPWAVDLAALADAVVAIADAGWPVGFLMLFDEPWLLAHQLKDAMELTTGNALLMDFSVFHVSGARRPPAVPEAAPAGARPPTAPASAGWPPHRDRGNDATAGAFRDDGSAQYSTFWVPLTDATTKNSCLMCVPRSHDPGYAAPGDCGRNPLSAVFSTASAFQHIRALPCNAGSLVTFTHRLLHWGSAAVEDAEGSAETPPRIALAFSASVNTFEQPFFSRDFLPLPPWELRCGLACGNLLLYGQNDDPGPELTQLLHRTFERARRVGQHAFGTSYVERVHAVTSLLRTRHVVAATAATAGAKTEAETEAAEAEATRGATRGNMASSSKHNLWNPSTSPEDENPTLSAAADEDDAVEAAKHCPPSSSLFDELAFDSDSCDDDVDGGPAGYYCAPASLRMLTASEQVEQDRFRDRSSTMPIPASHLVLGFAADWESRAAKDLAEAAVAGDELVDARAARSCAANGGSLPEVLALLALEPWRWTMEEYALNSVHSLRCFAFDDDGASFVDQFKTRRSKTSPETDTAGTLARQKHHQKWIAFEEKARERLCTRLEEITLPPAEARRIAQAVLLLQPSDYDEACLV